MSMQKRRLEDRQQPSDVYEDDVDDDIPLQHKRPFGAGLKRQRVQFVRAQEEDVTSAVAAEKTAAASAVGDLYASIVLSAAEATADTKDDDGAIKDAAESKPEEKKEDVVCDVCSLPITSSLAEHNASLAHQVSIQHSHPPSHLDRSRMGLRTLHAQGWDPDARIGLGREGEGVRFPIKVVPKEDTLGIGAVVPKLVAGKIKDDAKAKEEEKKKSLSKREMKEARKKEREKAERLQQEIYGRVDVERYLKG